MKNSATVLTYLPLSYHYRQKMYSYFTQTSEALHFVSPDCISYNKWLSLTVQWCSYNPLNAITFRTQTNQYKSFKESPAVWSSFQLLWAQFFQRCWDPNTQINTVEIWILTWNTIDIVSPTSTASIRSGIFIPGYKLGAIRKTERVTINCLF